MYCPGTVLVLLPYRTSSYTILFFSRVPVRVRYKYQSKNVQYWYRTCTWYRQRQVTVAKSLTSLNPNSFVLVGNYYLPKAYLKFVELVPKSADKRALLCKIVPTSIEVFVSVKCFRLFFGQVMLANTTQEFAEGLFRPEKKR